VEIPTIDMGNRAMRPAVVNDRAPGRLRIALYEVAMSEAV